MKGHQSRNCRQRLNCEQCSRQHPTSLHNPAKAGTNSQRNIPEQVQPAEPAYSHQVSSEHTHEDETTNPNASVCSAVGWCSGVTNSLIVPVLLHHKSHPEVEVMVYALLDEASDTTFVTTAVKEKLEVEGVQTKLVLSTMLGREEISVSKIDGLIVERIDKRVQVDLPRTYSRDQIPSRRDQIPRPEVADAWPHLQKIKNSIMPYRSDLEIGLLIGCNCPRAIKPKEVILGKGEDPYAVRTILGWGIIGPVDRSEEKRDVSEEEVAASCHRIVACEVNNGNNGNLSFVLNPKSKEEINPYSLRRMFEQDFSERAVGGPGLSKEDRRFLAIVEEGITQQEDGHYVLPLPLKNLSVSLPNNRDVAYRRLSQLKRRFLKDKSYREDYVAFMQGVIEKGYAERAEQRANVDDRGSHHVKSNNVWYIPHHGVYHPKKPSKIRVVFYCAAEFEGESLNKNLLQGPDLTNTLSGVLSRFRREPMGFMCDIESMFYQVCVSEEHRDLLRFLWWEGGDISAEPVEYRMTVHLFGATSSPGCANFALKRTAQDNAREFGSATAEFLRNDFYVDDGLTSCPTVGEANHLIRSVKEMCRRGGFNLHKFVSNKKEVIKRTPESDRAEGIKNIDLDLDRLPMERALGVHWCIHSDSFQFRIVLQDRPCTRRGILSTISSIFDPLGFIAPLILEGKSILQDLCRNDVGWDDPIPEEVKARWEKWRSELYLLERFALPRCFKPQNFGPVVRRELITFLMQAQRAMDSVVTCDWKMTRIKFIAPSLLASHV